MREEDHPGDANPADDPLSAGDPSNNPEHEPQQQPRVVSSARIVYCTSCGCQLDGLHIGEPCPNCQVPVGTASQGGGKSNGKAVAALVLGICSIVGCVLYGLPGIVCGILAILFASKVKRGIESKEMHASSMGMANAGRICGIIGLCLSTLYMLGSIAWFVYFFSYMMPQQQQLMQQQMHHQMQQQMQQTSPSPIQTTPAQPTQPDEAEPESPPEDL